MARPQSRVDLRRPPDRGVRREHELHASYDEFTHALLSLLGKTELDALAGGQPAGELEARLASFVGDSGLSLFQTIDHGNLLTSLGGRSVRASTFVFGNALIAVEMTKHVSRIGLYVPLRLYVEERGPNRVIATYDLPSECVAQFESPEASAAAAALDDKVEALIANAAARAAHAQGDHPTSTFISTH